MDDREYMKQPYGTAVNPLDLACSSICSGGLAPRH